MTTPNTPAALANVGNRPAPQSATDVVMMMQGEIQRALPKGLDADRVARLALTLIKKDRNLANSSPASFAGALLTASALGLEPGLNNEAHLVAYKGECTFILGYGGMVKLFWQHPLAAHIDAQAVHEHDEFDYAYGTSPYLTHKPAKANRGDVTHYYAVATLKTGATTFTVLTADEAKTLRGGKVGTKGGIADPMHWMERKTALRQLFKTLPKSTQMAQALEADEKDGSALHRELTASRELPAGSLEAAPYDPETGEVFEGEVVPDGE